MIAFAVAALPCGLGRRVGGGSPRSGPAARRRATRGSEPGSPERVSGTYRQLRPYRLV